MAKGQWLVVARREFLERVRTKWFVAVTLLGPIAMVAIIVIPGLLAVRSAEDRVRMVVIDERDNETAARMAEALQAELPYIEIEVSDPTATKEFLSGRIRRNEIDGYLVVPANVDDGGTIRYTGDNATNLQFMRILFDEISKIVQRSRAAATGMPKSTVDEVFARVRFAHQHDTGTGRASSGAASFIIGYVSMFIIYMAIILYAVNVLRSVVQEKTSRIVEIVVSAIRPRALMLGKIIGVGSVGLLQLGTWALFALVLLKYRVKVLGFFGIILPGFAIPEIGIADISVILLFFLLGYFFYASIYAAIGAMVSSEQEGQQAQTPVIIMLVIPVLCVQLVANDPRSFASELLTTIPLSAPVLMPMRYILGGVGWPGVLVALGLLLLSTIVVVLLAARIYRVGILMYGKRPSLPELWRWLRY